MLDRINNRRRGAVAAAVAALVLTGVSLPSVADETLAPQPAVQTADMGMDDGANDPLEPMNRVFFEFNEILQIMLLRPAATLYESFLPPEVQTAVGNVLENLSTPVVLANDLFQGEGQRAWRTTERFVVNSTFGGLGLYDFAEKEMGIEAHDEDFGQTIAVWGGPEGAYLVLPVFGPSNPRDAVGKLVIDSFLDPLGMWMGNAHQHAGLWARRSTTATDKYSGLADDLDHVRKTSVDYYAALRSMYRQKRETEIRNGRETDLPPIPDLTYDVEEGGFSTAQPGTAPGTASGSMEQVSEERAPVATPAP